MCPLEDEKWEEAGEIWAWLAARADSADYATQKISIMLKGYGFKNLQSR